MELRSRKKFKTTHPVEPPDNEIASKSPSTSHGVDGPINDNANDGAKTAGRQNTRQRRSKLEALNFPIDIFIEICSHLHPRDLASLLRTCKSIGRVVLHKHSMSKTWELVCKNAPDMPTRPSFMSSPAWVHLLYTPYCHGCGMVSVRKIIWPWFTRACSECLPKISYPWRTGISEIFSVDRDLIYHVSDEQRYIHRRFPVYAVNNPDMNPYEYYREPSALILRSSVDRYVKKIKALNADDPKLRKKTLKIREKQQAEMKKRSSCAQAGRDWSKKQEATRVSDIAHKREQRFEEIVRRLRANGWAKEIDYVGEKGLKSMAALPVVRRSSKLTSKEWNEVLHALDDFLTEARRKRVQDERLHALEGAVITHYVSLPRNASMDCRPEYIEFALMKQCRTLVEAPLSRNITQADFLKIIPGLGAKWLEEKKEMLRGHLQAQLDLPKASRRDPLDLAVATWICRSCSNFILLRFPAILAHRCAYKPWSEDQGLKYDRDDAYVTDAVSLHARKTLHYMDARIPYSFDRIFSPCYQHSNHSQLADIISAMGLDPKRATLEDVERCDVRLRCLPCSRSRQAKHDEIYGWEAAFEHIVRNTKVLYQADHSDAKLRWERIGEDKMETIRELEAAQAQPLLASHDSPVGVIWACALCIHWDGPGGQVQAHLKEQHGLENVDECVRDGTVYLHPSKSVRVPKPAVQLLR